MDDMVNLGTGPTLADTVPWLRDEAEQAERILDVVERNSVIEGLPEFSDETRDSLRRKLMAPSAREPAPVIDE